MSKGRTALIVVALALLAAALRLSTLLHALWRDAGSRWWSIPLAAVSALALFLTNTAYVVADGSVPHSGTRTSMTWTQFRLNARHDATLTGALRASWRVHSDGGYSSSPAIVGNTVYIGNNAGTLYAIDIRTGRVRWRYHVAASLMSNPLVWNGLVIEGEGDQQYVYNAADLSHPFKIGAGENALFAVDAARGTLRWRTAIPGTGMPTPAIINGRLIHHNGGGSILILDPQTGRIFTSANADGVGTMSAILPVGDDRFFTIGMFGGGPWILIHARFRTTLELRSARTGDALWTIEMPPEASGVGDCPPALAGSIAVCDYVAVGANPRPGQRATERAFGVDVNTGRIAWNAGLEAGRLPIWNRAAIPLVVSNTAYIGSSIAPYVHALDARDGRLLWQVHVRGTVKGGIARSSDAIYFGDLAGYLWAVNAKTGHVIGSKYMHTKFNVGSPVIAGQTLVIGSSSGSVIAVPLDAIRNSHDR